jgi:hypothetical protein
LGVERWTFGVFLIKDLGFIDGDGVGCGARFVTAIHLDHEVMVSRR